MMSSWRNTTAPPRPSVASSGKSAAAVKFVLDYSVPLFSSHHRNNHKAPSSSISISSSASSSSSSSSNSTYVNDEDTEFLFDEISSSSDDDNDEDERASLADEADDVVRGRASSSTKRTPAVPVPEGSAGLRSPHSSPYAISIDAPTSSRPFHRPSPPTMAKPSSSSDPVYSDFLSYQTRNRERRISNQTRTTTSRRLSRQKRKTTSRSSQDDNVDHDSDYRSRSSSQRSYQIQASEPISPATYLHASLDMPFSPEVLAWKLERYLRLSEQAIPPQSLPVRSKLPASDQIDVDASAALARLAEGGELDEQYERALRLAGWNKRGRAGTWEAPDDATSALRTLVASID